MVEFNHIVVLITVGSHEEAHRIAGGLVSGRKAACVNIVPQVNSIYRWKGEVEEDEEILLIIKTRAELFAEVVDLVKGIHSYEVAEIIALPIAEGNPDYLTWINGETEAR